jgi:hypothetical protein
VLKRFLEPPTGSEEYWLTRFVLLRLLGFVYFIAFLSLANQVLPLIGSRGLLPAARLFESDASFFDHPTIFWPAHSDAFLSAMSWVGVALSAVVMFGWASGVLMAVLWVLYLSFVHVGQAWYSFGWEIQLLETGFLAIFLCPPLDGRPFPARAPPVIVIVLFRWLAFRIMLGAGLIKIRGDDCWRDLTALYYHYETQPIPNAISRLLHFAPRWVHQLGCLFNHFIELVVPWFAFWPARGRRIAGILLIAFQILLIFSGNLSFLNWLTIVPCLACLDDGVWRRVLPKRLIAMADHAKEKAQPYKPVAAWCVAALVLALSFYPVANMLSSRQIMNTSFNPLHLVNTYGAFGSVGRERYEIVLEGTTDEVLTPQTRWVAYEFKAKPGDPNRMPPFVAPYHYRLDWEIWFAAMSDVYHHPWMAHLVWKLLHNDPATLSLLADLPFPKPPSFIRAELYRYQFTPPFSGADGYWTRTRVDAWLPPLSVNTPWLRRFLAQYGWVEP